MSLPIIEIQAIGKRYRIGATKEPYLSLRDELAKTAQGQRSEIRGRRSEGSQNSANTDFGAPSSSSIQHSEFDIQHSAFYAASDFHPPTSASPSSLTSDLRPLTSDFIWALKDVSFTVNQGEAFGIIGRNGAGKSTLLKILSQITPPTEGKIVMRGRVASLLEVGTGFPREHLLAGTLII